MSITPATIERFRTILSNEFFMNLSIEDAESILNRVSDDKAALTLSDREKKLQGIANSGKLIDTALEIGMGEEEIAKAAHTTVAVVRECRRGGIMTENEERHLVKVVALRMG